MIRAAKCCFGPEGPAAECRGERVYCTVRVTENWGGNTRMAQTSPMGQTAQQIANRVVVENNIVVKAPIQEVYSTWNDFTRFPEFMSNVEEVRPLSGNRYHWVARIFGIKEEWDAEVTERDPERRISWRSINGAQNAGTVSFSRLGQDKTEIRVRFEYAPPAGMFGRSLTQLAK